MAWRPTAYLIEGELDNTYPGKVTGWMRFAGIKEKITFDLKGNFHRDIRGAKIQFTGDGDEDNTEADEYMAGMAQHQTGDVGDITAGLPPQDYVKRPYLEWFSDDNGRVVVEPDADQVELIGRPIPACESDPISRKDQQHKMANFLSSLSSKANVLAIAIGGQTPFVSDPDFSHWIVVDGHIIGEAHSVESDGNDTSFAYVRLFSVPEGAEYGTIENKYLRNKETGQTN